MSQEATGEKCLVISTPMTGPRVGKGHVPTDVDAALVGQDVGCLRRRTARLVWKLRRERRRMEHSRTGASVCVQNMST